MFTLKLLRNLVLWISKSQPTQFLLLLLFVFLFFLFLYVGTYSVGKAQFCTVCPDGKFCPSTTTATVTDCAPGTFSSGGQERCNPCPSGWKCPDRSGTGNVKCLPVSGQDPLKSHWLFIGSISTSQRDLCFWLMVASDFLTVQGKAYLANLMALNEESIWKFYETFYVLKTMTKMAVLVILYNHLLKQAIMFSTDHDCAFSFCGRHWPLLTSFLRLVYTLNARSTQTYAILASLCCHVNLPLALLA